jgi:hypothetical protein
MSVLPLTWRTRDVDDAATVLKAEPPGTQIEDSPDARKSRRKTLRADKTQRCAAIRSPLGWHRLRSVSANKPRQRQLMQVYLDHEEDISNCCVLHQCCKIRRQRV